MQGISNGKNGDALDLKLKRLNQRPISMYETREGLNKMSNWHAFKTQVINLIWLRFVQLLIVKQFFS